MPIEWHKDNISIPKGYNRFGLVLSLQREKLSMKNWLDLLLPTTIDRSKYDGRPVDSRTSDWTAAILPIYQILLMFWLVLLILGISLAHKMVVTKMGYVFTMGNMAISWMSTKQMLVATSSNHVEIIVLHGVIFVYDWGLLLHIFEEKVVWGYPLRNLLAFMRIMLLASRWWARFH